MLGWVGMNTYNYTIILLRMHTECKLHIHFPHSRKSI